MQKIHRKLPNPVSTLNKINGMFHQLLLRHQNLKAYLKRNAEPFWELLTSKAAANHMRRTELIYVLERFDLNDGSSITISIVFPLAGMPSIILTKFEFDANVEAMVHHQIGYEKLQTISRFIWQKLLFLSKGTSVLLGNIVAHFSLHKVCPTLMAFVNPLLTTSVP